MKVSYAARDWLIYWPGHRLDHALKKHNIVLEDIREVESDPWRGFTLGKRGRYIFTGRDRSGRLLSLIVEPERGYFVGITARPATPPEIRKYRGV